jgi:glycosyltransferase involved in cell wall biosynthesis
VRGNFFIPDARKYWIKPSIKYLTKWLGENKVDAVISTGPPHSMHLIALGLQKKLNLPWLADFRDPWTNIDFYEELRLSARSDRKHHRLERTVLESADVVTTIGKTLDEELKDLGAKNSAVVYNGYDDADVASEVALDELFSIAHIGALSPSRNHPILWEALAELSQENPDFAAKLQIKLIGKVDIAALNSIDAVGLTDKIKKIEYLPHSEVVVAQQQAQVLLLLLNDTPNAKGILTGKFFEYMSARRPILAIGHPDGDAAALINETQCGHLAGFDEKEKVKGQIETLFKAYKAGELTVNSKHIEQFTRRNLAGKIATLLENIVK